MLQSKAIDSLGNKLQNKIVQKLIVDKREDFPTQPFEKAGCNHNINYGMEFAVMFLDSVEEQDFISQIRSHNNRVGRLVSG